MDLITQLSSLQRSLSSNCSSAVSSNHNSGSEGDIRTAVAADELGAAVLKRADTDPYRYVNKENNP